jgi:protein tyrosine phosphatase (PTP) superfamily phosphohydrolase (DUF442 family)
MPLRAAPLAFLIGIAAATAQPSSSFPPIGKPMRIEAEGLHNVFQLNDRLLSGSSPEGDEGFRSLQKLGVRTILSVDGAKPDVERAARFGMRYIHVPIGYDGVRRIDALRMAKAVRDLPGPVYMHCHHGKHRGPAAVAVVSLCLDDRCAVADLVGFMKSAGTDPKYAGLFQTVKTFARPTGKELDAAASDFPSIAKVGALAERMVEVDAANDRLKEVQKAGWKRNDANPDLDPPHEALMLREHYLEAIRLPKVAAGPPELRALFEQAERETGELEALLREAADGKLDRARLDSSFKNVADSCTRCHARFRDILSR